MRLSEAISALDVASLVPPRYAAYRPLLVDGLGFFLDRLDADRQASILAEQLALPADTSLAARFTRLLSRCPTLHKLGQVLARDRRLAPDLRRSLVRLETGPASVDLSEVLPLLRRELGDDPRVDIGSGALAQASVAVVVPARFRESAAEPALRAVLKVLKPGVTGHLEEELGIWQALADYLEERSQHHELPALPYRRTLDGVSLRLVNEVRLEREQAHIVRARAQLGAEPGILVPRLLPLSTPRVTAMERVDGVKLTDAAGTGAQRAALASRLCEALLARPFWSREPVAEFHADPHAGNLIATTDGRLAVIDWSLVAHVGAADRAAVLQTLLGALALEPARVERGVRSLALRCGDDAALGRIVEQAVRAVRHGQLPGLDWVVALLDRAATGARVEFSGEFVLFRKALLTLAGVLADVAPGHSADPALARVGLARFLEDVPLGMQHPVLGGGLGARLSAVDVLDLWGALSLAPARFWLGSWGDALAGR